MLKDELKDRDDKILALQIAYNAAKEAACKLKNVLGQNKLKFEKEKSLLLKEHRAELKSWKKDLGNERREKIKLVKQLENISNKNEIHNKKQKTETYNEKHAEPEQNTSEITCTICGDLIYNFQPNYFCGEMCNPACQTCKANDRLWSQDNPFASFPTSSPPASLVSHWLLPPLEISPQNPGSIPSLVCHCVKLPNPGDTFISMEEVFELMKKLFDEKLSNFRL